MKNLLQLVLAIGLGLAAAGLNMLWLRSNASAPQYVALAADVKEGDVLSEENLEAVRIPGPQEERVRTFLPWDGKAILYGKPATRNYQAKELVLQRDLLQAMREPKWEVLGSYRLISVGETFVDSDEPGRSNRSVRSVTVAVPFPYDEKTARLIQIIDPQAGRAIDDERTRRQFRIVAVQVEGATDEAVAEELAGSGDDETGDTGSVRHIRGLREGEVGLIVPLPSVEVVPSVLLEARNISFVVPSLKLD